MKQYTIPQVGKTVRVTTRHKNINLWVKGKFYSNTYEGTVLPSNKWDARNTFNMTGDSRTRTRVIALSSVTDLRVLSKTARFEKVNKTEQNPIRAFKVKSGDKEYVVTYDGKKANCNCVGFMYRRKCKHSAAVVEKLKRVA